MNLHFIKVGRAENMLRKMEPDPQNPGFSLEELIAEEEQCVFEKFTNSDAQKLAEIMFDICEENHISLGFEIYLNGMTVFKCMPDSCTKLNDVWMQKKINTVLTTNWSTMHLWAMQHMIGKQRDADLMPKDEYAMCGGGFPIRVRGAGVIGAVACSGSFDQQEHLFCVEALRQYITKYI